MGRFVHQAANWDGGARKPLWFALSLCIGAAWYVSVWEEPGLWPLVGAFGGAVALFATYRRWQRSMGCVSLILLVCSGLTCGALAGKLATMRVSHPVVASPIGPVMVEGWVEDVEPADRGVRLRLIVHAIDDLERRRLPDRIRLTHTTRLTMESGRFVRCWAVLRPPPAPIIPGDYAFHRQAYYEGLGAVGYVQGRCRGGTLGQPKDIVAQAQLSVSKLRRRLAHYVNGAAGERSGGFAAALASGDRSFMRSEDQEALRGSGLAHLLAISGLHMGIVGGLVYLIVWRGLALIGPLALRISVQKPAALAALVATATYLVLSGASVSTQRAFVMALILFGAVLFDRAALSLRSLSIAMIIVVLLAPWSVLTPGFQMSFAATGALIATYEAWQRRRRASPQPSRGPVFWLQSLFVTSLVSGLATAPFAIYHFERFAGLGLFANLLAMPIVSLVSAPLAGAALILAPFGGSGLALRAFGESLEWILSIASYFDGLAPGGLHPSSAMPSSVLAILTASMVLAMVCRGWRLRLTIGLLVLGAGLYVWARTPPASLHWAPSGDVYLVDASGTTQRVTLINGDGLAPLRFVDLEQDQDCQERVCQFEVDGLQLRFISRSDEMTCDRRADFTLTLQDTGTLPQCDTPSASWAAVQEAGGLSWRLSNGQITPIKKPPCGIREWHPCVR